MANSEGYCKCCTWVTLISLEQIILRGVPGSWEAHWIRHVFSPSCPFQSPSNWKGRLRVEETLQEPFCSWTTPLSEACTGKDSRWVYILSAIHELYWDSFTIFPVDLYSLSHHCFSPTYLHVCLSWLMLLVLSSHLAWSNRGGWHSQHTCGGWKQFIG